MSSAKVRVGVGWDRGALGVRHADIRCDVGLGLGHQQSVVEVERQRQAICAQQRGRQLQSLGRKAKPPPAFPADLTVICSTSGA